MVRTCSTGTGSGWLVTLALSMAMPAAHGATTCFNQSCATICTPPAPVGIDTLIADNEFPATAPTPIVFVDPNDGSSRRLVATQEGTILVWDGTTSALLPTPFIDLRDDVGGPVLAGGERGLLAMAVEPNYAQTGRFYVFYTGSDGDVTIARYQRSAGNPATADPASATIILRINHPASNHNGGWLAFGPDGFLYISTGDGGGGCDGGVGANGDGQRNDTLNGKILRIAVRGEPGGAPDDCGVTQANYTIPASNPFAGQEPACDEVWTLGLRNPFRFSFDRATGDMYIGDVGQDNFEEINIQAAATPAPVNFGWVCREGCGAASLSPSSCSTAGCSVDAGTTCLFPRPAGNLWDPALCHSNPGGWASIMGGYRYRGTLVPSLSGNYFYSDAGCGQIWRTTTLDTSNQAAISASCWANGFGGDYGFAEDAIGELYVVVGGAGRIDCIHNGAGCFWAGWAGAFFADGFENVVRRPAESSKSVVAGRGIPEHRNPEACTAPDDAGTASSD
jgi:glucose/arabinose dehydrogenase